MHVVDQKESKAKDPDERTRPDSRLVVSNNPQTYHSLLYLPFVDNATSPAAKYGSMPVDAKVDKVSYFCGDYILESSFDNNCQKYSNGEHHECFDTARLYKSSKHLFYWMILNNIKDNEPNQYIFDLYLNCNLRLWHLKNLTN